jgi:hypothetical protein
MNGAEARQILEALDQPPALVLEALRVEVGLGDSALSHVVGRSPQTVRRWRRGDASTDIPESAADALDDLRTIAGMLVAADFSGSGIKSFLRSRNTGLGRDRPLDGVRAGVGAFRRVESVTECFIAGIAPEPGDPLETDEGKQHAPARRKTPAPRPGSPQSSVEGGR